MADENPVTSGGAAVPPKANPLAHSVGTASFPRPGSTVAGLKPGVRPPTRPAIHKPGTATAAPAGLKLPPKPGAASAPAPAVASAAKSPSTTSAIENLKSVTQNLKSITAPLPQQAILHKTGIIGGAELSETQKMAAKSKTMRISLSEASGSAAVSNDAAPMKTIRIKRPVGIGGAAAAPEQTGSTEPASGAETAASSTPTVTSPSVTQRKTLKIQRPGGVVRPSGKFGAKKPAEPAAAEGEKKDAAEGEVAELPPENPSGSPGVATPPPRAVDPKYEPDVGKGLAIATLIAQIAACVAIGFLCYLFNENIQQIPNWFIPD